MKEYEEVRITNVLSFVFFYEICFVNLDSIKSSSSVIAPKSLREWHEQPVNLSEQPPLTEKVNVQILSPNTDRVIDE